MILILAVSSITVLQVFFLQEETLVSSCPKTSGQKALRALLNQKQQSAFTLSSLFDIRNSLSLSSSFMFKIFNIFSINNQADYLDVSIIIL